ncbi:MAG: RNA polymerase sigma factor [Roseiflexaceae bacterium]
MVSDEITTPDGLNSALFAERARLVRLCASLTGAPSAAEDLAQETLLEAWRSWAKLADRQALAPWLSGIARNVCRRWRRRRGREAMYMMREALDDAATQPATSLDDDGDPTIELERHELAALLDRALALLPPETRLALVQHYIEESSHAAIAARLGLSEGAVAVRLHRGKLAFRRLIEGQLRPEAETFGLVAPQAEQRGWHETRLWCPECGQHRLLGYLDTQHGDFSVRCPDCSPEPGLEISRTVEHPGCFDGVKGFKAAYTRSLNWAYRYYRGALANQQTGMAPCWECGRPIPLLLRLPYDDPDVHPRQRGRRGVYVRCDCRAGQRRHCSTLPRSLTLHLPEGQRFWREHPRMRFLPEREVDIGGQAAVVGGFESLGDSARLEVVALRDTFAVISINGMAYVPDRDG